MKIEIESTVFPPKKLIEIDRSLITEINRALHLTVSNCAYCVDVTE